MSNCGCNQTPTSACGANLSVPVDMLVSPSSSPCPTSGASVAFHTAPNGFVVPPTGGQSAMQVANGSVFAVGQWIQFVNPAGTFRIMSITGNTLVLSNAAADGVTPITSNPVPPLQYGQNAQFVTVAQPSELSPAQFIAKIQEALASATSLCFNTIPEKSASEQTFLLGYVKSSLCGENEGCCLRKMPENGPYINEAGVMVFQSAVQAPAFNTPVPSGGIPSSNSTILNPNNGTGGGFLVPLINPTTGLTTYIDLFSGAANGSSYTVSISNTGVVSLEPAMKEKIYYPDKQVTKGSGPNYAGYPLNAVSVAAITGDPLPAWATHVRVLISCRASTGSDDALKVRLNGQIASELAFRDSSEYSYEKELIIPITGGNFDLQIVTYNNINGTSLGTVDFDQSGVNTGFIRVAITGILRLNG